MRRLEAGLLTAACLVSAARGQEAPPAYQERIDVEVINVDVIVTDRAGRPVSGLTGDDFELRIDGKLRPIEYFSGPVAAPPVAENPPVAGEGSAAPKGEEPALLLVFIDQTGLVAKARERALRELDGVVAGWPGDVMVATFDQDLRILASPGGAAAARTALAGLAKTPPPASAMTLAERTQLETQIRFLGNAMSSVPAARAVNLIASETVRLKFEVENFAEREVTRERRALAALRGFFSSLAALDGRKAVAFASAGFASQPSAALARLFSQVTRGADGSDLEARLELQSHDVIADFEAALAAAQDARLTLYTVSPLDGREVQGDAQFGSAGFDAPASARDPATVSAASSLARLAGATGGRTLLLAEGLEEKLGSVLDETAGAYLLGFTSGDPGDRDSHRITVGVRRDGLTVRHRTDYRRRTAAERAEQALYATASLGGASNPLGIALEPGAIQPLDAKQKASSLAFAVHVPIGRLTLVPGGDAREGRLAVRVAFRDDGGRVRAGQPASHVVRVPETDLARATAEDWVYRAELRLGPGKYLVVAAVTDEVSGATSTTAREITIPGRR